MLSLLKFISGSWEEAKGFLREDLDHIEAAINERWHKVFGTGDTLNASAIDGDATPATRYVANTGTDNAPTWDTVDLSNGVSARLPFSHLAAATGGSKLVGRESGSAGDFEEITPGPGLAISGTTLQVHLGSLAGSLPLGYVNDGEDGQDGRPGQSGQTGPTGLQGIQGLDGQDGEDGVQGPPGPVGLQGPQGLIGPPGQDGDPVEDGWSRGTNGTTIPAFQCSAYSSTAQTLSNATFTAITYDTEDYDTGAIHSVSSNTSRMTVPPGGAGLWEFLVGLTFDANATGGRLVRFYKNGSALTYGQVSVPVNSGSFGTAVNSVIHASLVDGDYIEVFGYQTSGGNLDIGTPANLQYTTLQCKRLDPI